MCWIVPHCAVVGNCIWTCPQSYVLSDISVQYISVCYSSVVRKTRVVPFTMLYCSFKYFPQMSRNVLNVTSVSPGKTLLCWLYIEAWQVYSTPLWNYLTKRRVETGLSVWRGGNKSRKSCEYKRVGGAPRTSLNAGANRRKPAWTARAHSPKVVFFYMLLASKTDSHVCPTAEDGQGVNYQIKGSHIWTAFYKTSMIPQPQTECVAASAQLLPVDPSFPSSRKGWKGWCLPLVAFIKKKEKNYPNFL